MSEANQNERMVTPEQIDDLRHMLGMTTSVRKGQWGYRNHYAVAHGDTVTMAKMVQMVDMGLLEAGNATITMQYFHCTVEGCKAAGLSKAGIRRVGYSV